MILGAISDEQFGPLIMMGFGGIHAEIVNDVVVAAPPLDAVTARQHLKRLSMYSILGGVRGQSAYDIQSYCEAAAHLSAFMLNFSDSVAEVDINPVKVMNSGCIGLDALIVKKNIQPFESQERQVVNS